MKEGWQKPSLPLWRCNPKASARSAPECRGKFMCEETLD
ncbi:hypothetical protein Cadr_000018282 [Camelus dromedarius]|uniref:Uncharacterized protein n=1 Tax=Camelus dromedarius TaxID=9838 RepID=A0A5N4D6R1_CAMDR|nr:hypothetical protein Cadr_000018282 [Camelus dromedarius]